MKQRHARRDDPWDRIQDRLPGRAGHVGVTAADKRLFVEAVRYRYRTGIPWRALPERFGDFRVVHLRFSRGSQSGVWKRVFSGWAEEADNEWVRMDSSLVRAHPHRAGALRKGPEVGQAIGRRRGGLGTKIHATVDALGNPTGFHLPPAKPTTSSAPMSGCRTPRRMPSWRTKPMMRKSGGLSRWTTRANRS